MYLISRPSPLCKSSPVGACSCGEVVARGNFFSLPRLVAPFLVARVVENFRDPFSLNCVATRWCVLRY